MYNIKKLWQLINNVIKHTHDKTSIIDYITVDNIKYHETKDVANQFGKYYSEIGAKLANKIKTTDHDNKYYLNKITTNPKTMYIHNITSSAIIKYINKLPSKNSSGYNNNSNILLKQIKFAIAKPLTHIFKISFTSGIFPKKMKLSEIIPLYKKGHKDQMTNYRPILLLIT